MSRRSRKWMAAMLFAMSLLFFFGGNLQAARIRMTTRLGFGDCVIPGRWVPLRVQITGAVESARVEVVRYNEGDSNPSHESFTLPNMGSAPGSFEIPIMADFKIKNLIIRLYRGDQPLTKQSLDFSKKTFPGHLILTINLPATEQQAIEKSLLPLEPVLTVPIRPKELPSLGLNYDGVSGVVINEPELVLTPAQIKSLRSWLAGGGRMVIFTADQQPPSWIRGLISVSGSPATQQDSEVFPSEAFPVGFGSLTLIHQERETIGFLRSPGGWRGVLNLKPYSRTYPLSPSRCFPSTYIAKTDQKLSLFNPLSVFLVFWAGSGVFVSVIRKRKPSVNHFLIITLLSVAVAIPLGGKLAATWKHGAVWHTRAVILPDGGGTLLDTTIHLNTSNKWESGVSGSPWGVAIKGASDENGGIKINNNSRRERGITLWRHQQTASRYSLRSGGATNLVLTGCIPEFGVNLSGISINTPDSMNIKFHQLMIPNETISWDGKRWRLLISYNLNDPLWQEISKPPEWFRDDAEWMKGFQSSSPDTLWLGGRFLLPKDLCLKIQGGPIPETFWVMPAPSNIKI